jgi:hypothetical protein
LSAGKVIAGPESKVRRRRPPMPRPSDCAPALSLIWVDETTEREGSNIARTASYSSIINILSIRDLLWAAGVRLSVFLWDMSSVTAPYARTWTLSLAGHPS